LVNLILVYVKQNKSREIDNIEPVTGVQLLILIFY